MKWIAFVLMGAAFVMLARQFIIRRMDIEEHDCDCQECKARNGGL